METGDLRIFQAIARTGNMTKAARDLNYVPSNLTARMRILEEELGQALFYRTNRGMQLTSAGQQLLTHVEHILQLMELAVESTRSQGQISGSLRLGMVEPAAIHKLAALWTQVQADWPLVRLSVITDETHALLQQVREQRLDAAVIYGPFEEEGLTYSPLYSDRLVLVSAVAEPWEQLLHRPMLYFDAGCTHRARMNGLLIEHGVTYPDWRECGTLGMIVQAVAAGIGVSLLPLTIAALHPHLIVQELPASIQHLELGLVYATAHHRSDTLQALKESCSRLLWELGTQDSLL